MLGRRRSFASPQLASTRRMTIPPLSVRRGPVSQPLAPQVASLPPRELAEKCRLGLRLVSTVPCAQHIVLCLRRLQQFPLRHQLPSPPLAPTSPPCARHYHSPTLGAVCAASAPFGYTMASTVRAKPLPTPALAREPRHAQRAIPGACYPPGVCARAASAFVHVRMSRLLVLLPSSTPS